jgi:phospholipid-binding lipoprotein MlaA
MIPIENRFDPIGQIDHTRTRNATSVVRVVDTRANLLRLGNLLDDVALDKYSFTRDAHLQRRRAAIYQPGQEDDSNKPDTSDKK